jgi:phytoene/squalene synthetase
MSTPRTGAALYDAVAARTATEVIGAYSSSFGRASRLLAEPVRTWVRSVYAFVRLADEVVDASELPLTVAERSAALDELEAQTARALTSGFSTNLVVHAFARTARRCGIGPDLVDPFFASMRTDLHRTEHDEASLETYVYGSAEVVGLMCLRAFLADEPDRAGAYDELAPAARRLGAAFQVVNFLRDLAADHDDLGRTYLGLEPGTLTAAQRDAVLDEVDTDLAAGADAVPTPPPPRAAPIDRLPASSRAAVRAAHDLYAALAARLRRTPPEQIARRRVHVPATAKGRAVAQVVLATVVRR